MKRLFGLLVAGLLMAASAFAAPTTTTYTTLSAALNATATTATIASATGISASSTSGVPSTTYLLVDNELMKITAISSTTVTLVRGQDNTIPASHASGAYAVYGFFASGTQWDNKATGSPTYGVFLDKGTRPVGACTRSSQQYSPLFYIGSPTINGGNPVAEIFDCVGAKWTFGPWPGAAPTNRLCTPGVGAVAYGSVGTSTTFVSGTEYVVSVNITGTTLLTGISALVNGTVGTDKFLVTLRDSTGIPLAYSAVAGATTSGANTFNDRAFALVNGAAGTTIWLTPGTYYFGVQGNGTTDGIRTVAASTFLNVLGKSVTGTFGTIPATYAVPTTLTANTGPYSCGY